MGILEDILDRLDSLDGKIMELLAPASGETKPVKPAKKAAAKKKAEKGEAKKAGVPTAKFLGAIKEFSVEHRDKITAARDEQFDPEMKVRDIPIEERQAFLDRIAALIEEEDEL